LEQIIVRTRSREQNPTIRHHEMLARSWDRLVIRRELAVLAVTVEVGRGQLQHVRVAPDIKRRDRPILVPGEELTGAALDFGGTRYLAGDERVELDTSVRRTWTDLECHCHLIECDFHRLRQQRVFKVEARSLEWELPRGDSDTPHELLRSSRFVGGELVSEREQVPIERNRLAPRPLRRGPCAPE